MGIDRRDFLKTVGIVGVTVAAGDLIAAESSTDNPVEFFGILYDSTRCVGCQTCESVCAETHGLPQPEEMPEVGVVRKTDENHRTVVNCYSTDKGDLYVKSQCMHCNEPACAAACLTTAMYKTKEGPVIWREDKCMGCRYCMVSCPFDVPKFEYNSQNPKIQKCTMCYERIIEGKIPACAENCPAEAITFGTRREMLDEAHKRIVENPDTYINEVYGEHVAGGTAFEYVSSVSFDQLGMRNSLQNEAYPKFSKGFLFSVPAVFVLVPSVLLGIYEATKRNQREKGTENE